MFEHFFNIYSSTLVSSLTGWKGTTGSRKTILPENTLELFDRENCEECRAVRQALTELNLDVLIYPCPEQGSRYRQLLNDRSGSEQLPYLEDVNSGMKLVGKTAILDYLFDHYGQKAVPEKYTHQPLNGVLDQAISASIKVLRFGKGGKAQPSKPAALPLMLYSFESSPFCRPVRELMCELELPYTLINLGKQQRADLGPAFKRMHIGEYVPVKGSKRETFLEKYQDVMVPFLIDPNTGTELFQSKRILSYLKRQYAKH